MKKICKKCKSDKTNSNNWYSSGDQWLCSSCHCKNRYAKSKIKLEDRACSNCDNEFSPTRKDNIYCSRLCGDQAARAKRGKDATNKYFKNKYKTDINRRLSQAARSRINKALSGSYKWHGTIESLGCSPKELKKHLENQFTEGMTWDNYGLKGWHMDHITPLDSFDLKDEQEYLEACHYTNLQPLWAIDNLSKGNR